MAEKRTWENTYEIGMGVWVGEGRMNSGGEFNSTTSQDDTNRKASQETREALPWLQWLLSPYLFPSSFHLIRFS